MVWQGAPDAIATLAAYGRALGIKGLLSTPLIQAGQLGIGLTENHTARRQIQLFVSRGPNAEFGLAVFVIVESLAGMVCGWLRELRYLPPAFRDEAVSLEHIKRFCSWCGLLGITCMAAVC